MRSIRVWARLLGLRGAVIEDVTVNDAGDGVEVVVAVRPGWRERDRCGICGRRSGRFDRGGGRRRWRGLDLGTSFCWIEADAPRVRCSRHGVVVARVPWARHDSGFTRAFEDQVAWLAVNCSKSAVAQLMRCSWRSVGRIVERVCNEQRLKVDLLSGLRSIGIDEISHRRGQRYLTVVVDHHTGRLVWAAPGRDRATVLVFFATLGEERCKEIESVSCDMAGWISSAVAEAVPQAERCVDPFHVVQLASDALDEVRRELWREARREKNLTLAKDLKGARFCVWKNPENLTDKQQAKLAVIQKLNGPLYRAYLLKEQLRQIYRADSPEEAEALLDGWLCWARRCRLPAFTKLARTIKAQRDGILAAVRLGLSNARVEQINTQIRLITRRAYGFHSAAALIALAMLTLSGLCPPLPDRVK
ncbi:ISL3 family transposase [Conexibacter sp. DBS9H8]|uniref:ISL3 family transposase n=1 Tax=Conexibacter sp. DBS9H8 TaxID=2937801 RepID=UPI00200CCC1C|nr:ISL3 family transposase [Conexibacter sp. DBS9H8]